MAKISAQDTTPGHAFSTADLMLSITVNPRAELRLGPAFCSPVKLDVSSSRIEPSHPCIYIYACYDYDYKERTKETIMLLSWDARKRSTKQFTLTKQSWKKRRRIDAPIRGWLLTADLTPDLTVESRLGQEVE